MDFRTLGLGGWVLWASVAAASAQLVRVPLTSLTLPAQAPAYSYTVVPALGDIAFPEPTQVLFAPGETDRVFVVEREGRVSVVRNLAAPTREVFLDLTSRVGNGGPDHGLLAMAFHPRFASNGTFFLWYSMVQDGTRYNRLARFSLSATHPAVADPLSETPLLTQQTGPGGHDGGALAFGSDGYLYLSLGDGDSGYAPAVVSHQRVDADFFGAILRLDVDQGPGSLPPNPHRSVHPGTYRVPADNPFVGATTFNGAAVAPTAVRTEFWAVGLRNPFRIAFDEPTGRLWCADVGLDLREEINLITRGANYGWDFREGAGAGPRVNQQPAGVAFTDPIFDYDHSLGLSITGGLVYRGARFPELQGRYLYADFVSGRIWALADSGQRPLPAAQTRQIALETGIVGFTTQPGTGDILLADLDSSRIKRLVAAPAGPALPPTLTATGAFTSVAGLTPAPGWVAYEPNVSFWSDHARKRRWFALPDATSRFGFSPDAAWTLPTGAVWMKHFDLELTRGEPATARRIETRFLVKTADGVYGLSYRWNEAQTEATLVAEDGDERVLTIQEPGQPGIRQQRWRFPGRGECLQCHTAAGGGALSFNTRQLNRAFPESDGPQLTALASAGYLSVSSVSPAALPALVPANDVFSPIEARARSYLDANCSQCHQPGGLGRGNWDARFSTLLSAAGIVNGLLVEGRGDPAERVLVPGHPEQSALLSRISASGALRMPPLGSSELDPAGKSLLSQWIASLAPGPADRLANLAARAEARAGSEALITGFSVSGAARRVLIRAVGPGLAAYGVSGVLARPRLLVRPLGIETLVASNQRWEDSADRAALTAAFGATGAFPLAAGSADSALLVTLPPGGYTAEATGVEGDTGVALVEVYDAGGAAGEGRLSNASVRAVVGVDARLLIPGLVIAGAAPRTVLVRVAGPALAEFGVSGTLGEPLLTLFSGSQAVASNSGWTQGANVAAVRAAFSSTGAFAFPEGSRDCALLVHLAPGGYTLQVSGANRSTGVVLVEVYDVP
ncbi:MAG: PQQ-dependent sugar dehydrogenase [Opitutaceae bacterium]